MHRMVPPRSGFVALLLAVVWLVPPSVTPVSAHDQTLPLNATTQDIDIAADGTLRLATTAQSAPPTYGSFQRFGLYDSATSSFSQPFNRITTRYTRTAGADSRVRVDVRASRDLKQWSEWQLDVANGAVVTFGSRMLAAQYRVVILSNSATSPTVSAISLTPQSGGFSIQSNDQTAVAPTYRLRATRQGMVGGRTANGHIIQPNDFFVSLPSARALSSRDGNEYLVRLSANGRSVVVPVWDNGPWNYHDDYWNKNRETYRDLPVGWPEDHAAYYENYNGGSSERGKVRFPSAVDIGDGAYWALGLAGEQAVVDVTFLWLGTDPGANPKPLNNRPAERPGPAQPREATQPTPEPAPPPAPLPPEPVIEVNDTDTTFSAQGSSWNTFEGSCGYNGQARWTRTVGREDSATHQAVWRPQLRGGTYDVYVYMPNCSSGYKKTRIARYIVVHGQGATTVERDQLAGTGQWIALGRFTFAPGSNGYVQLRNTGSDNEAMWFDAVRWVPVTP